MNYCVNRGLNGSKMGSPRIFFCNFLLVHAIVRVTNGRREWNQMQISIGFCPRLAVRMNHCINAFIIVFSVYDSGTCFSPAILDITDDDLRAKFMEVGTKHIQLCCILFGMSCYVKPGKIGRPIWRMKPWCLNLDVSNDDRLSLQSYKLANSSNCPKHFVVIGISDDTWYHTKIRLMSTWK